MPHARLAGVEDPILVIGRSGLGVDFDASDGQPAHIICLQLTPLYDQSLQIEMLRMIAETFQHPARLENAMSAENYTEFLAAIRLPKAALHDNGHNHTVGDQNPG